MHALSHVNEEAENSKVYCVNGWNCQQFETANKQSVVATFDNY